MRLRAWALSLMVGLMVGLVVGLPVSAPASAYTVSLDPQTGPNFEMPFLCGEKWTGTSRWYHSPSKYAVDWNAPGDAGHPVLAAASGTVSKVVWGTRSYGIYVVIDHGNGVSTLYAHLQTTWVTVGQRLDQGEAFALVGNTGNSFGAHLHFEQRLNSTVVPPYFHRTPWVMGRTVASTNCPDTPLTGDWNGDRRTDVAVVRRTATGAQALLRKPRSVVTVAFGVGWDTYFSGDMDASGSTDLTVRAPNDATFETRLSATSQQSLDFGAPTARGIVGDWNGDRDADVGTWRPDTGQFMLRLSPTRTRTLTLAGLGDRPVVGDWDGNGVFDLGVYNSATSTFALRAKDGSLTTLAWGQPGDLPLSGDWNGDGVWDIGVWHPATATFVLRYVPVGTTTVRTKQIVFGTPRAL